LAVAKELGTAAGREVDPKGGGFKRGSDNPLECDLLVVDETSMVDVTVDAGVELVRRENAAVSSNQRALFIDEHHDGPAHSRIEAAICATCSGV
jgi:ATP-dependent exoDNAse (exonuclease V) alpha subunit